jgi:circadian clock protein KaiC
MSDSVARDHQRGIAGWTTCWAAACSGRRLYLFEGVPGSGKTTLALQFLLAAASRGEKVLYVTLSETTEELRSVASSHGWSLDAIAVHELTPNQGALDPDEQSTMFHPSELELAATTRQILEDVDRLSPSCIVFDSLSELRLLAGSALRYRRQILALKQYFASRGCTVMLLDDMTRRTTTCRCRALPMPWFFSTSSTPSTGPTGGGCGS